MKRARLPTSPGDLAELPFLKGRDRELMAAIVVTKRLQPTVRTLYGLSRVITGMYYRYTNETRPSRVIESRGGRKQPNGEEGRRFVGLEVGLWKCCLSLGIMK